MYKPKRDLSAYQKPDIQHLEEKLGHDREKFFMHIMIPSLDFIVAERESMVNKTHEEKQWLYEFYNTILLSFLTEEAQIMIQDFYLDSAEYENGIEKRIEKATKRYNKTRGKK